MKRKYRLRKIKTKKSYTSEELAVVLNIHPQTVRDWKRNGLKPLEENTSPHLFLGSEVKTYLSKLISSQKVKLQEGEFYCFSCRKAVKPASFEIVHRGILIGKTRESLMLKAKCPNCSRVMNRFSSDSIIKETKEIKIRKSQSKVEEDLEKDSISLFDL